MKIFRIENFPLPIPRSISGNTKVFAGGSQTKVSSTHSEVHLPFSHNLMWWGWSLNKTVNGALNGFRTELIQWKENVVPEFRKKKPRNSKNTCPVNQVLHLSACGSASSSTHETCSGLERYPGQGQSQPRHDSACAQPRDLDHFPGHHGRDSDLIVIFYFALIFVFAFLIFLHCEWGIQYLRVSTTLRTCNHGGVVLHFWLTLWKKCKCEKRTYVHTHTK